MLPTVMSDETIRYEGEDNRITSKRELWGWYSYGLAAEVFTVCGVGSFLPMTLEQLTREVGVLQSNKSLPCVNTGPNTTSQGPNTASPDRNITSQLLSIRDDNQCIVDLFGYELNTSSFTLYSFSLAIVVQTLVLISIGSIADYGSNRKRLLLVLGFTGAIACMLFIFVYPGIYIAGLILTIISVASLGSSFVLLNSFLPLLVANHPSIRAEEDPHIVSVPLHDFAPSSNEGSALNDEDILHDDLQTTRLLNSHPPPEILLEPEKLSYALKLSNTISSKGIGIGYAASVLVQLISIGVVLMYQKTKDGVPNATMPLRTVLFIVGSWWAAFTIPTALWLRRRPGPPLPWSADSNSKGGLLGGLRYIAFAWVSLWRTIKIALLLPEVVKFLLGWFLLSDSVATVMGTSILFARTELQLSAAFVALLSITATVAGIAGAFCWPLIAHKFRLSSISIILSCIVLMELIPLYGLLGFIPFFKSLGVIGLQRWWEIYPLGFLLGFVMGGISSYCRSVFGSLVPPGKEAAFYALYAVTDKGSSVIGPAIVGRIIDVTGSIRMAFWFLAVLMISPAVFFWFVDVEKGRTEGLKLELRRSSSYLPVSDSLDAASVAE